MTISKNISLAILVVLINISCKNTADSKNNEAEKPFIEGAVQEPANGYYELLMSSFRDNETNEEIYPDYFGGAYINADDNLVIKIVGDSMEGRKKVIEIIGGEDIVIESVKNNYKALVELNEQIQKIMLDENKNEYAKNIISLALTPMGESYVEVGLEKFDEKHIQEFKRYVMDSPNIRFVQGHLGFDLVEEVHLE